MYNKQEYLDKIDKCIANGPYKDNWESLSHHETPEWFKKCKFGIFIHWGLFSVPAFNNEWYARNMYIEGTPEFEHQVKTYGPHTEFGYKDFIPMFKAEKFSAKEWVDLFEKAGAKYVIPVAEHHDGFQMYKSDISEWNAYNMGPKTDVLGELTKEIKSHGMVNGASTHRIEHWFFLGNGRKFPSDINDDVKFGDMYWPSMEDPEELHDTESTPVPTEEFLTDWMIRTVDLIDNYRPNELYFDWWIQHKSAKPYLKKLAAYYYNRALEWGQDVHITYKHDAFMFGCATVDIERGQFSEIKPFYWQTDTAVAKNSWCYTTGNIYKKPENIVRDLVDVVAKNGSMLLNVGPKADGTIPDEDKNILLSIGEWMDKNGESIYETSTWRIAEEGPTKTVEGQFTDGEDKVFTKEDFRFTVKGENLYATCLNYPEDGEVVIRALGHLDASSLPNFAGFVKNVEVLGFDEKPEFERKTEGLFIKTKNVASSYPVVFKITLD